MVTAVWQTWTAVEQRQNGDRDDRRSDQVHDLRQRRRRPRPAASVNLTITAKDANNSTVTTYTGSHSLIFSGACAEPGGDQPDRRQQRRHRGRLRQRHRAHLHHRRRHRRLDQKRRPEDLQSGRRDIVATEGSITTPTPLALTVSPPRPRNSCSPRPTPTPAAGADDNLTITAQDTYGNTATAYTGTHSLDLLRRRPPAPAATSRR